ncbi:MAG: 2-oxoglutarate dehydrogenase E1 component [Verrucomicrobia bacterium]|nr:2-oxoglutarate dehydrogenase E1 component [Verrucomicrobiota bacterium]
MQYGPCMAEDKTSQPLHFSNQSYVLQWLKQYQEDPRSLPPDWLAFFQGMEFASYGSQPSNSKTDDKQARALALHRRLGHLEARHNPMFLNAPLAELSFAALGFKEGDEALLSLKKAFTDTSSFQYDHLESKEMRDFLDEAVLKERPLEVESLRFVIEELYRAKKFEDFLQKKFIGAKRFSLEGCEMFIPLLKELFSLAGTAGIKEIVIGMAHRGRLNVLCNALGKPYYALLKEFGAKTLPKPGAGLGDVKYHKGYAATVTTRKGDTLSLVLSANPSHLESVDPVVLGYVRAKIRLTKEPHSTLPILIHGDASVAGQGVVYETLQMNALEGYGVGGTIHIVINNQVGFTTAPEEGRSTRYCTDIAKAFDMPIIHVNAEDPLATLRAVTIAFAFREKFGKDVFIDLNGHRFWGHNETDEPMFTNPKLYKAIKTKENVYQELSKKLLTDAVFTKESLEEMQKTYDTTLEKAYEERDNAYEEKISDFQHLKEKEALSDTYLREIGIKASTIPSSFPAHPKVLKVFENRVASLTKGEGIDWGAGEMLAYATLLNGGAHIRISGQDVRRGTFSHRHAAVYSQESDELYIPLSHINPEAPFEIYNSLLSEFAVMGYEFGYTLGYPNALVIWEAQYGDFVNGAQIIIDQYLAGSETKWGVTSNLTLLLPHGFEGGGPEHSSCRFERFLELSGLDNWRVAYPTTPAQFFHLLRRQVWDSKRKPLIVVTPKSMLRLSSSFSKLSDFSKGSFQPILTENIDRKEIRRVILCTGKIYYELQKRDDIAIIRVEELYPFPDVLKKSLLSLSHAKEFVWVQEEPKNQGAFLYMQSEIQPLLQDKVLRYIGRPTSSIPDTGYPALFVEEQKRIIDEAAL